MSPSWKQVTECARHTEKYLQGVEKELVWESATRVIIMYMSMSLHTLCSKFLLFQVESKNILTIEILKHMCDWKVIGLERQRHPRISSCCFTTYQLLFQLLDLGFLHWNKRSQTTMNKKTDMCSKIDDYMSTHVKSTQVKSTEYWMIFIQVLATNGDTQLGGDDFDRRRWG